MNNNSKSAVSAIQAVVLIEYGDNESYFEKAIECVKYACNLNPTNSYWLYLHSLVLTAHRYFLKSVISCPTENENNTIRQAIAVSGDQNLMYIKYCKMKLFKDTIVYNYYTNINNKSNYLCDVKKIAQMIMYVK